jgi:hypothetical protein
MVWKGGRQGGCFDENKTRESVSERGSRLTKREFSHRAASLCDFPPIVVTRQQ